MERVPAVRCVFGEGLHPGGSLLAALALLLLAAPARAGSFSELMHRGVVAQQSGRLGEAADSFREALEAEPASEPARKMLAGAAAALGIASLHAGRLRESREHLEEAVESRPESAEHHLLLAGVLYRLAEPALARREVDQALKLSPDQDEARELSGDLYYGEGRLNMAIAEWERAAKTRGRPVLSEKIDRGRVEMDAEQGMQRETSRYFLVQYKSDLPPEIVRAFFEVLDQAFDILHDQLGDYPRDEIQVILYSNVAFRDVTRAPVWAGGLYDGKIRLPVGGLRSIQEINQHLYLVVHEMTHAFLYHMAPEGLPLWFNEGLATAFQGWHPDLIRQWFAEHPPLGLARLGDVDLCLRGGLGDVTAGYAAARLAIGDIVEARGIGAVRGIIAGVGAGRPFPEVFKDEVRLDLEEFEAGWQRYLR